MFFVWRGGDEIRGRTVGADGSWFSGGQTCQKVGDWGFEAARGDEPGASPPHRSLCTGSHPFSERRGAWFCQERGAMRSGGGRSVPMIRGFLGDRPAESAPIRSLKLRGAARPVFHHPTARFTLVPILSRGGGELGSMRMAEAMVARGGRSMPVVRGFLGDRPIKMPADWGFEASRGGQDGPHRSLRSGRPLFGEEGGLFPRGGGRQWGRGASDRCRCFVVFSGTNLLEGR